VDFLGELGDVFAIFAVNSFLSAGGRLPHPSRFSKGGKRPVAQSLP